MCVKNARPVASSPISSHAPATQGALQSHLGTAPGTASGSTNAFPECSFQLLDLPGLIWAAHMPRGQRRPLEGLPCPSALSCLGCCCHRPDLTHPTPVAWGEGSCKCTQCLYISEASPAQRYRTGITCYPRGTGPSPRSLSLESGLGAADSNWRLAGGAAEQACGTGPSSRTLSLQTVTSPPSSPLTSGWPPASA